jgi:hypothetical protein
LNPLVEELVESIQRGPKIRPPLPVSDLVGRSLLVVRHSDKPLAKLGDGRAQVRVVVGLGRPGHDRAAADAERRDASALVRDGEWLGT